MNVKAALKCRLCFKRHGLVKCKGTTCPILFKHRKRQLSKFVFSALSRFFLGMLCSSQSQVLLRKVVFNRFCCAEMSGFAETFGTNGQNQRDNENLQYIICTLNTRNSEDFQ